MKQFLLLCVGLFICSACQLSVPENDNGYFMTGGQMADFIVRGEVMDSCENTYSVNAIPGYWGVLKVTGDYFTTAGESLALFVDSAHYLNALSASETLFVEGAWKLSLRNITYMMTLKTWRDNFTAVSQSRNTKEVTKFIFGYPFATITSTVATAFIVPIGILSAGISTVSGVTYPVVYIPTRPILGAVFSTIGGAIVFPCGIVWNTLTAPFGAVLVNCPNPNDSDDNFFTKITSKNALEEDEDTSEGHQISLDKLSDLFKDATCSLDSKLTKTCEKEKHLKLELEACQTEISNLSAQYAQELKNETKIKVLIHKMSESELVYTREDISKITKKSFENLREKDRLFMNDYLFEIYQKACAEPVNRRLPNTKKSQCTTDHE